MMEIYNFIFENFEIHFKIEFTESCWLLDVPFLCGVGISFDLLESSLSSLSILVDQKLLQNFKKIKIFSRLTHNFQCKPRKFYIRVE